MSEVNFQIIIKHLARQWRLSEKQYLCLLRLEPDAASELLKIDTTLAQLFACNPWMAELWMTSNNKALGNSSPMDLIEKEGMTGLRKVVQILCLEDVQ